MTKQEAILKLLEQGCDQELAVWVAYGLTGTVGYNYAIAALCGDSNWAWSDSDVSVAAATLITRGQEHAACVIEAEAKRN